MDSLQIRKLNKFRAEQAFMTDNAADFPKNSPGDQTARRLAEVVTLIETLVGQQMSLAMRQHVGVKDALFAELVEILQKINRAASGLADEIVGIDRRFRLPRRWTQARWLATARAFHADCEPYQNEFAPFDLGPAFRDELAALIEAIERSMRDAAGAEEQKAGATGALREAFREGDKWSRKLNAIARNKYARDAGKLAAWKVAAHLEARPRRKASSKP